MMKKIYTGDVVSFNHKRGFGKIALDEEHLLMPDGHLFVHARSIRSRGLQRFDKVSFKIVQDNSGRFEATDVKGGTIPRVSDERASGVISSYNETQRYGFIQYGSKRYFFHTDNIESRDQPPGSNIIGREVSFVLGGRAAFYIRFHPAIITSKMSSPQLSQNSTAENSPISNSNVELSNSPSISKEIASFREQLRDLQERHVDLQEKYQQLQKKTSDETTAVTRTSRDFQKSFLEITRSMKENQKGIFNVVESLKGDLQNVKQSVVETQELCLVLSTQYKDTRREMAERYQQEQKLQPQMKVVEKENQNSVQKRMEYVIDKMRNSYGKITPENAISHLIPILNIIILLSISVFIFHTFGLPTYVSFKKRKFRMQKFIVDLMIHGFLWYGVPYYHEKMLQIAKEKARSGNH